LIARVRQRLHIAATAADPSLFRSGREFAAWLGMTPRQEGDTLAELARSYHVGISTIRRAPRRMTHTEPRHAGIQRA
jgi:transposase